MIVPEVFPPKPLSLKVLDGGPDHTTTGGVTGLVTGGVTGLVTGGVTGLVTGGVTGLVTGGVTGLVTGGAAPTSLTFTMALLVKLALSLTVNRNTKVVLLGTKGALNEGLGSDELLKVTAGVPAI
jgi:hypothetical protein